jgi:uncharacterized SAM-binding protein YcdF (DUF218 family)
MFCYDQRVAARSMTIHDFHPRPVVPSLLITLGAPNDMQGVLSPIALGRARAAIREYRRRPGCKLVVTGGYGKHFNTTDKPHAHHVTRFLLEGGVAAADMTQIADSSNTVDDARLSMPVVERFDVHVLCVITSDFHRERAGLIFRVFYPHHALEVIGEPTELPPEERQRVCEHETRAIQQLRAQGGVIVGAEDSARLWLLRDPLP